SVNQYHDAVSSTTFSLNYKTKKQEWTTFGLAKLIESIDVMLSIRSGCCGLYLDRQCLAFEIMARTERTTPDFDCRWHTDALGQPHMNEPKFPKQPCNIFILHDGLGDVRPESLPSIEDKLGCVSRSFRYISDGG